MIIWTLLKKEKQVEDMDPSQKEETGRRYGPFSKRRNRSKIQTLFGKEDSSRRYGPSSKRRNKSKIWTLLGKEEQVKDINPPWTKGE